MSMRIDDLARESGLTVDTIRYYQREELLPPSERDGRHRVYTDAHLRRLTRFMELQARRFSIAAIRAVVSGDGGLEGVFTDEGEKFRYTYEELLERSGVSAEMAESLKAAGVLRDPHEFGRIAYDGDDLEMLKAIAELDRLGVPPKALHALGRIYTEGIEATQRRVVDVFRGGTEVDWKPDELQRFQVAAAAQPHALLQSMRRLVDYTHHRTIQRLALAAIERGDIPGVDPTPDDPTTELRIDLT
jgi:DNA-binding transcriptional MerR regulator